MWLLPQISGERYSQMNMDGLTLSKDAIYHPDSSSLNQTVARISVNGNLGGTGAFVSQKGLLLTSRNIISNTVTFNSSDDSNFYRDGFYADSASQEIPISDFELYVLVEQQEVTEQINKHLSDSLRYREQYQQSQTIRRQLIAKRKRKNDGLVVQINDMWADNRQFMSVYKVIRDVRLVHLPPAKVTDQINSTSNKRWPQYSGSHAFLRAYVSPSGHGSRYDSTNIPFSPARHLSISQSGVSSGDFAMTLGYPGQTSRHESSYALEFDHNHRIPIAIDAYEAILAGLKYEAAQDPQSATQNASRHRSVAQTLAYYKEIQKGIKSRNLIARKRNRETQFKQWVKKDSLRNMRYRRVLQQLDQAYNIASQTGDLLYATVYTLNNNRLFEIADLYHSYRQVLEDSTQQNIRQTYTDSLLSRHKALISDMSLEAQSITLSQMIEMLATLPEGKVMFHLITLFDNAKGDTLTNQIADYIDTQQDQSIIFNFDRAKKFMQLPVDSARAQPVDDIVQLYREIQDSYQFSRKNYVQHVAYQRPAQKRYVEGMQEFQSSFAKYPDANGTLRISTGRVAGFTASDSVFYPPLANTSKKLATRNTSGFLRQYQNQEKPATVNFLSTNDVTDGSYGSPIVDGNGTLIGLNFDTNPAGPASDYLHDPQARAVNLDAGYMLFLLDRYTANSRLLDELSIKTETKK